MNLGDPDSFYGTLITASVVMLLFLVIWDLVIQGGIQMYALLPGVDMINHKPGSATKVQFEYFWDQLVVRTGRKGYVMGEQVFISYGDKDNDALMETYGFAEENNPFDVYHFAHTLDRLREVQPFDESRI